MMRWLGSRSSPRAMILGYHRVTSPGKDVYDICVGPDHFAQQMDVIKRHYRPISLSEMVNGLLSGTLPQKSVVVTFDDGYVDNLTQAKPLLERFDIPATVFISSGNLGGEFWWDELFRRIVTSPALPEPIQFTIAGEDFHWNIHETAGEERSNRRLHELLYDRLLPLDANQRAEAMETIRNWSGNQPTDSETTRALELAEIIALADGGLVDIGAHSLTHPILSRLPVDEQRHEIQHSKTRLENILDRPVTGFAYPNGFFTKATQDIVKESGFAYACSSKRDVVWRSEDLYQLPRFWPRNWDGDRFARDLRLWLG
jgi:peptidoglycan/xylan/chitin deacetylase (PgdA/CDA1 family)